MRDQNQTRGGERGQGGKKSREHERQRHRVGVDDIVDRGARARSGEIGEHRQVGRKKQQHEDRPRKPGMGIERHGDGERGDTFEPEQQANAA